MRDSASGATNSLISEPVVLKVRFNRRVWMQVDFVQETALANNSEKPGFSVAVLGPVPASHIAQALHCKHGRGLSRGTGVARSFADGRLRGGIQRLRSKTGAFRLDAFLLLWMGSLFRALTVWLRGRRSPEVTAGDELRRLCARR